MHTDLLLAAPDARASVEMAVVSPRDDEATNAHDDEREAARAERRRALVDAHATFVWRMLARFGLARHDVDDGCQEVFLIASRKIDDIAVGRERSFLIGTAIRVTARIRSSRSTRELSDDGVLDEHADPAPDVSPEALLDAKRARALLDRCLDAMPPELRVVFVLFELEDETMASIAAALDLPAGTVASRLRRARERFFEIANRLQNKGDRRHA